MFSQKMVYWASRPIIGTYTNAMLNMNVQMHEQLPRGAKIIAANHPSTTDPFFIACMLRQQSFIMIKDILFQIPLFGVYLRRSGHIPVKAGCGQQAIDTALEHLKAGHTIIIFPEGLISPLTGGFHKPHSGVARLALQSGAPVYPVGIHLQRERIHSTRSTVNGQVEYGHWYLSGPYHVTVGHPLTFHGDAENHPYVNRMTEMIMRRIIELTYESENRFNHQNGAVNGDFEMI